MGGSDEEWFKDFDNEDMSASEGDPASPYPGSSEEDEDPGPGPSSTLSNKSSAYTVIDKQSLHRIQVRRRLPAHCLCCLPSPACAAG